MPKYKYLVINQENKQLQGTIGAPDVQTARQELNELGFSIVSINEIQDEQTTSENAENIITFEFAAIDKNQKRVVGTIQAADRYSAFKRLVFEYAFEVEYIVDNALSEDQKQKERQKSIYDLQDKLNEEQALTQVKESNDEKDMKEFALKQDVLKSQINFVLNKVKELLDLYEKEMKPETKEKIRRAVDKILRIRNSTNLDYVRKSAEDLLTFLQQEELFMNEQSRMKERMQMVVEAHSMMMQLKRSKSKTSNSIGDQLRQWRQDHIVNNSAPSGVEQFINLLISPFIGAQPESDEIVNIKRDIATTNQQIFQYVQMYFQAPSPEFKSETKTGLLRLISERKKLKAKLRETIHSQHQKVLSSGEKTSFEKFLQELISFSGWLLCFYLVYYFVSIYITTKELGLPTLPVFMDIYHSNFLKYFVTTIFLLHAALSIKQSFFRRNELAGIVIAPLFFFSTLIVLFNF
jgi:hypothetical protein